jgi:type 1 glutamine amidotransferase
VSELLVLGGGVGHDLEPHLHVLAELAADAGLGVRSVDDPVRAAEDLSSAGPGDVLAVCCLHSSGTHPSAAHLRSDAAPLDDEGFDRIAEFVRRGGGMLALHTAVVSFDGAAPWRALTGATWSWSRSAHPPVRPSSIQVTRAGRQHPITEHCDDFEIVDEVYGFLDHDVDVEALLTSDHGGRSHPVLWARTIADGRVVTDVLGHDHRSLDHPVHRAILTRSLQWVRGDGRDSTCLHP